MPRLLLALPDRGRRRGPERLRFGVVRFEGQRLLDLTQRRRRIAALEFLPGPVDRGANGGLLFVDRRVNAIDAARWPGLRRR